MSAIAVYDGTTTDPAYLEAVGRFNARSGAAPYTPRGIDEIAGYLDGLDVLEPGVVLVSRWRPDPGDGEPPAVPSAGGVARKP